MYLLIVNYIKTPEEVAPYLEAHSVWGKKYFDQGIFLVAGPKKSKLGGAILVKSINKEQLKQILTEDSFVKADVAEYQIIDFDCKITAAELEFLKIA